MADKENEKIEVEEEEEPELTEAQKFVRNAHLALATKGQYTLEEIAAAGLEEGKDGVVCKTLPYVNTGHQWKMLSAKKRGPCANCKKTFDELRCLDAEADPGPYICGRTETAKEIRAASKPAWTPAWGKGGGYGSGAAGRGAGSGGKEGRAFGGRKK